MAWVPVGLPLSHDAGVDSAAGGAVLTNLQAEQVVGGSPESFCLRQTPAVVVKTSAVGNANGACKFGASVISVFGTDVYQTIPGSLSHTDIGNAANAWHNSVETSTHAVFVSPAGSFAATDVAVVTVTPPAGVFVSVAYQDGYTVYARSGTDEFYVSALDDPTTIGALDFSSADALPGEIVGVISDHRELVIFKKTSTEFWSNTGGAFPFSRAQPGVVEIGAIDGSAIAKIDNKIFFVGGDWVVYVLDGYRAARVSAPGVSILDSIGVASVVSCAVVSGRKMVFVAGAAGGSALVYDVDLGSWHKRTSSSLSYFKKVIDFGNSGVVVHGKYHASGLAFAGVLDDAAYLDTGESVAARSFSCPHVDAAPGRATMSAVRLEAKKQTAAGDVGLTYSDDNGVTYSSSKTCSGLLQTVQFWRLGRFTRRILKFTFVANSAITVMGVSADIERLE